MLYSVSDLEAFLASTDGLIPGAPIRAEDA
jgi:hypothetical protein